ncbi:STM4015 family protein [Streptomyces sp. NPDC001288]|uniref:STM4015 family protein n=1 Tax=Streptomyces sp. NPDC001297 TaxID=3364559 RepID=UPI0036C56653
MSHAQHLVSLYGLPTHQFPYADAPPDDVPAPDGVAWRIDFDGAGWTVAFARFCATVDTTRVRALIVGCWEDPFGTGPTDVIGALVAARDRFPALRAVFLGDMDSEECEISWINQTDVAPLLAAFPQFEEFGVRGGNELRFSTVSHGALRKLVIETGGLPAEVVRGVGASDLPALEHLDLWLGTPEYGGDSEAADLEPILSGGRLPSLRHLALRNSEMQDAVAAAVASAPVVARLEVLDLSMGVLTDEGAAALLRGQPLTHLKKLDLHHHYLTKSLQDRLRQTLAGVELDLDRDDAWEDTNDDGRVWRYVAVSE